MKPYSVPSPVHTTDGGKMDPSVYRQVVIRGFGRHVRHHLVSKFVNVIIPGDELHAHMQCTHGTHTKWRRTLL
jgi:hypothetical protein